MCLAAACGRWDSGFEASIEPARVLMCGVRDLDAGERVLVDTSGVNNVRPSEVVARLAGQKVYVHLDLDVLDPTILPSQFAVPGGLSDTGLRTLLTEVAVECDVVGLEVTAFEDPEGNVELVESIVRAAARRDRRRRPAAARGAGRDRPARGARPRRRSTASRGSSPRCCTSPSRCSRWSPPTARCSRAPSASANVRSTPLSHSFCRHVVESGAPLEVVDARSHPKVRDNPAIEDYGIVSYLGMPLTTSTGERLGALCAIDHEPRQWTGRDHGVLEDLAGAAMAEVELRRANRAVGRGGRGAALRGHARHAHAARQPPRAARRPRAAAGRRPRRDLRAVRPARHARLQRPARPPRGRRAAGQARRAAGEHAGRPRARVPARRRPAVRACWTPARRTSSVGRGWPPPTRTSGVRLPRRDRRPAARGGERRRRAAPRGRAAGRLRACCDRWR